MSPFLFLTAHDIATCLSPGVHSFPSPTRPRFWSHITANTASAVAPPLFRASPIDPTYRPPSTPLNESRLEEYRIHRSHSPLPPTAVYGKDISRPSSTTLPSSSSLYLSQPQFHTRSASLSLGRGYHSEPRPALPGLSALASLGGAPPLRYAEFERGGCKNTTDMLYRSFSGSHGSPLAHYGLLNPVPTPGIAGSAPVSTR